MPGSIGDEIDAKLRQAMLTKAASVKNRVDKVAALMKKAPEMSDLKAFAKGLVEALADATAASQVLWDITMAITESRCEQLEGVIEFEQDRRSKKTVLKFDIGGGMEPFPPRPEWPT